MKKEKIIGFNVCTDTENNIVKNVYKDYINNNQIVIASINPEIIINNYKNKYFIDEINSFEYQIPDGIGIVYASQKQNGNINKRITGIDLMQKLCEKSVYYNLKIFLYGAKPGIAEKAKDELKKTYQNINIVRCL